VTEKARGIVHNAQLKETRPRAPAQEDAALAPRAARRSDVLCPRAPHAAHGRCTVANADDLAFQPAHRLAHLIRQELSPAELTELALSRTERLSPKLNAFITVAAFEEAQPRAGKRPPVS